MALPNPAALLGAMAGGGRPPMGGGMKPPGRGMPMPGMGAPVPKPKPKAKKKPPVPTASGKPMAAGPSPYKGMKVPKVK